MIEFLMLQAVAPLTLGALPRQALPAAGCAAYLWSRAEQPQLIAVVGAEPGSLRLMLDGKPLDMRRVAAEGTTARGLASTSVYAAGDTSATLTLSAVERPDLADGALVQEATLTVTPAGKDVIVAPLGGLIGCATAAPAPPNRRPG